MRQCKRQLNHEAAPEDASQKQLPIQAVTVRVRTSDDDMSSADQRTQEDDPEEDVEVVDMHACTTSTNTSDDYAHRGVKLLTMPFYIYRMYVRRVQKPGGAAARAPTMFPFEPHYPMSRSYMQEVILHNISVPSIDGFQCPTWIEDPEQNSLLKTLLFTPWRCDDPMTCGDCSKFAHLLSNCSCKEDGVAIQPADASSRKYTFERAWRLRCSELHVLAQRAEGRCDAARKKLVMADTILFANKKEPSADIEKGEVIKNLLRGFATSRLRRTMPLEAMRQILAFCDQHHAWHDEQCSLAEFCANLAIDVVAHIDLAAEARVKPPKKKNEHAEADEDADTDAELDAQRERKQIEIVDITGGAGDDVEEDDEDVPPSEVSSFPVHDPRQVIGFALQQNDLHNLESKRRRSAAEKQLKNLDRAYGSMLKQNFTKRVDGNHVHGISFKDKFADMVALQNQNVKLMKQQAAPDGDDCDNADDAWLPVLPADPDQQTKTVPLQLAQQGPAATAWQLITDAGCTEEQIDAVALLAWDLEKRFDSRPDKTTHLLPVATAEHNHRAVWLGGGGVGKTRTLQLVVEPLAVTFFGENGYAAAAQSNHAAQNLGPRGRTLHSANGLLMTDSLQTARLRLNSRTQQKMIRLTGSLGVDVIDELGCVSGTLLHADALRKTYGRSLQHDLPTTAYMKPQETWGRMAAKILCGDFYQLPPVPATASLLASTKGQTYEHQQGRKLLADMQYCPRISNPKKRNLATRYLKQISRSCTSSLI